MLRQEANTRLDNQLSRRNCQMFSTGFNSGARAGSSTSVRLSGTTRSLARCHPARSISMTPWAPGATACDTSARCRLMACVSHRGSTKAAPLPCWKPVWHILSDGDVILILANAAHVKNVPGRKTDVADAAWLADLLAHGLVRASFVP